MIDTNEVIEYFDGLASGWDESLVRNEAVINRILDNAGVREGKDVLDVACGTGVLFPDYLNRKVKSLTAIDISSKMVEIARTKFPEENIRVLCGDVETTDFGQLFDCIVVYNAFPHFPYPERLIASLASKLKPDGTLTIAHGMSRAKIEAHHSGSAKHVSNGLMAVEDLAAILNRYLEVTVTTSNEEMYQATARQTVNR